MVVARALRIAWRGRRELSSGAPGVDGRRLHRRLSRRSRQRRRRGRSLLERGVVEEMRSGSGRMEVANLGLVGESGIRRGCRCLLHRER